DLFTYFTGMWLLSRLQYRPRPKMQELQLKFFDERAEGCRYLTKRIGLISMIVNNIIGGFIIGALIPLLLHFMQENLNAGEKEYGVILSIFGLGGIVGGWVSHRLSLHFKTGSVIVTSIVIEPFMMAWWILNSNLYVAYLIFFIWGVLVFTRIPTQLNHISETVPDSVLSQMFALLDLAFVVPNISSGILLTMIAND